MFLAAFNEAYHALQTLADYYGPTLQWGGKGEQWRGSDGREEPWHSSSWWSLHQNDMFHACTVASVYVWVNSQNRLMDINRHFYVTVTTLLFKFSMNIGISFFTKCALACCNGHTRNRYTFKGSLFQNYWPEKSVQCDIKRNLYDGDMS